MSTQKSFFIDKNSSNLSFDGVTCDWSNVHDIITFAPLFDLPWIRALLCLIDEDQVTWTGNELRNPALAVVEALIEKSSNKFLINFYKNLQGAGHSHINLFIQFYIYT